MLNLGKPSAWLRRTRYLARWPALEGLAGLAAPAISILNVLAVLAVAESAKFKFYSKV